jgi:uncharacterized protein
LASLEGRRDREPAAPAAAADSRTLVAGTRFGWARQAGADTLLLLHVRPGAKVASLLGTHDGRLKVAVNAPPIDGKANDALLEFLAAVLRLPRRRLRLESGLASRSKSVRIEAADADTITQRLLARLAA